MDFFKPTPQNVTVRLESKPSGADARTSLGPGCKTPCSVSVPVTENFSVSYTLERFEPQTVAVKTSTVSGDFASPSTVVTDPNPVFAELQPVAPPKRAAPHPHHKRAPKPAAAAPAAAAPADSGSAFPPPPSR
jgi:hypothetical protein